MTNTMMECGHTAQGTIGQDRAPVCVACVGIHPGARTPTAAPDLTGRIASCTCGQERPSSVGLPFFEHRPNEDRDGYYSGCFGWD